MDSREEFIKVIEEMMNDPRMTKGAQEYFNKIKNEKSSALSEKAIAVLKFMKDRYENCNKFIASQIGEGIGVNSRSVSGTMRKLCEDGLVIKQGANPVEYSITPNGIAAV